MASAYRLPDEPSPSGLSRFTVDPMWPLLALILAGNAYGLAWFVFNGVALGTPQRGREWLYVAAGLLGPFMVVFLLGVASINGWLTPPQLQYAALGIIATKLVAGYAIYMSQARGFEIWQHYGGDPANGLPPLVLLAFFGRRLLGSDSLPTWLSGVLS